jgi:frataxin-like iron-binding protein CyaY
LELKLRKEIEDELEEEEAAFRKDRQTQDHIFTLRKITK